jgi:hypothetical protein
MTESCVWVARAGIRDRQPGQVAVQPQPFTLAAYFSHFLGYKRLADCFQRRNQGLGFFPTQPAQGAADAGVVCPSWLFPGFSNRLVFLQRMRRQTDFLQLAQPAHQGYQKLQYLCLWFMTIHLLFQRNCLEGFHQPGFLCKLAPGHQKCVLGLENLLVIFAHGPSNFPD